MVATPAAVRPSRSAPKRFCVRGHDMSKTGFNWNANTHRPGVTYLTRRCKLCAVIDVQACRARKALRKSKKRAA